jgi:hypothetical protein
MIYNLADKTELKAARNRMTYLAHKGQMAKLTKYSPGRSLAQNNYLHLLLGAFGMNFGYTLEESKQIYKNINREIYTYSKINRGKAMHFMRSSADLTKEEMAKTIDRFMLKSSEAGFDLPLATNEEWLRSI